MRHRDIHLLTVGRYTYTSDQRFEAQHYPHTEEWTLKIRYPQRKDSGIYECQISTTPPIGHSVHLTIVGKNINNYSSLLSQKKKKINIIRFSFFQFLSRKVLFDNLAYYKGKKKCNFAKLHYVKYHQRPDPKAFDINFL